MSAGERAVELAAAVEAAGGALPLPVGPEPKALPLAGPICTQAEARAAGLDIAPSVEELDAMASSIVAVGDPLSAEVSLAQAVPLLGAAVTTLRARVAELEAERHVTNAALDDAAQALRANRDCFETVRALCDAADAAGITSGGWFTVEAIRKALGLAAPDAMTRTFVPVASLREPEGEFYPTVHHTYRLGHDLPETGGDGRG